MGIVWEAYHKGVPLLGSLKIPLNLVVVCPMFKSRGPF